MVKHTQTIRRNLPTNCLSVFHHFVGLALKGLNYIIRMLKECAFSDLPIKTIKSENLNKKRECEFAF